MQTVYQISWFNLVAVRWLWLGFCFLVISTGVWISVFRRERRYRRVFYFICWMIFLGIGIGWLAVVVRTGNQYKTALQTGQCRVVEGTVSVLEVGWPSGHGHNERIRIGTETFSYNEESISYHWLIRNGGPLTNGAYARLHVLDGDILKVEIRH